MRVTVSFIAAASLVLAVTGCMSAQSGAQLAAQSAENTTCRKILTPGDENGRVVCGTAEQWVEFERRAELINAGVTCRDRLNRSSNTISEYCFTNEQWAEFERAESQTTARQVDFRRGLFGGAF